MFSISNHLDGHLPLALRHNRYKCLCKCCFEILPSVVKGARNPPSRVMQFWRANTIRLASTPVPGVSSRVGGRVDTTARYQVEGEYNAIPFCRCFAWGLQTTILWSSQAGCNKHLGLWYGTFIERKATHSSYKTYTVQTKPWVIYYSTHTKHIMDYDMGNIKLNGSVSLPSWWYLYRWWSPLNHWSILVNILIWGCLHCLRKGKYKWDPFIAAFQLFTLGLCFMPP